MKFIKALFLRTAPALVLLSASYASQAAVIQAEDYSAFYDTTPGNAGGAYRGDAVDIEATSDSGGGYNVGWIEATEWLAYNGINFPTTGSYTIKLRVASPNSGTSASVDLNGGSLVLGTVNIPNTGGWQNWQTVTLNATVNAGTYNLGVYAATSGWNLNWIEVTSNGGGGGGGGVATVYQHCNYTGWSVSVGAGSYTLGALRGLGFVDNDASSIRVAPGYEAVLFEHDNFQGASLVRTGNDDCLVNEGFNDKFTSMIVRPTSGGGGGGATWSDEFDFIDFNTWTFETGGGGWGNNELQYYTNGNNASIQYDGAAGSNVLVIEARREGGYNCWYGACQYTSTRMISRGKKEFGFGRIEARIRMTQTQGGWPAFWMLGSNFGTVGWPACGEIDIMEHINNDGSIHGTMHWQDHNNNYANYGGSTGANVTGYHVYAVERDANEIRWYLDGNLYHVANIAGGINGTSEFQNTFFLLLNFAVGGNWPGSPNGSSQFPQRMYVDYVRYYQ
ncbi:family 16 glycosylhydrolase [Exilibacterium tricleocarpae]|uniref:Family 16 glycosylhydrolase n=1 Tax=Exilibacterium tricleocarpae TaxID=2591008 RepID=A0A545SLV5_9GAMM|nr:carbohydrate-binding protein [Exilibacterium tricleocarpae]TQV65959.1 family 16 glycosylhydrolase [Exilibacterium tricleocarpae]